MVLSLVLPTAATGLLTLRPWRRRQRPTGGWTNVWDKCGRRPVGQADCPTLAACPHLSDCQHPTPVRLSAPSRKPSQLSASAWQGLSVISDDVQKQYSGDCIISALRPISPPVRSSESRDPTHIVILSSSTWIKEYAIDIPTHFHPITHLEYPVHVGRLLPLPLGLFDVEPGLLGDLQEVG